MGLLDQSFPSPNGGLLDFSDPAVWDLIRKRLLSGDRAMSGDTLDLGAHPSLMGSDAAPQMTRSMAPDPASNPALLQGGGGNVMAPTPTAPPQAEPQAAPDRWGKDSDLWTLLLAMGAGIAGGGAPGGGGLGAGISKGLTLGMNELGDIQDRKLKQQAYDLQLAELKNTMDYQNKSLGISQQNADSETGARADVATGRAQDRALKESQIGGYLSIINAEKGNFANLAKKALDAYVVPGSSIASMTRLVTAAARINGDNPKEMIDQYVPATIGESGETKRNKIEGLANYLNDMPNTVGGGYPTLADKWWKPGDFKVEAKQSANPGQQGVRAGAASQAPAQSFASEEAAAAAGLEPGTRVIINGVPGTWQ